MSQEARPTIKDPQNGNPVITKQEGRHHWVVLQDFRIKGGENSVRTIDTAVSKRSYRPGTWKLRNIIAYGGTAHLVGPRFTLENCHFKNISSIPEEYYGKTVYPAIRSLGATFGIWGGSYTTDRGTDATVISSGAFSISGGVTFDNHSDMLDEKADLTFQSASRGFVSGISCENSNIDMRFGISSASNFGLVDTVFAGPSVGAGGLESKIEVNKNSHNIVYMTPNVDITVDTTDNDGRAKILFLTDRNVKIEGGNPQDVSRIGWGGDGDLTIGGVQNGYTQLKTDVVSKEPKYPVVGGEVIADGTNWDPAGTGNAAKVIYTGNKWSILKEFDQAI